MGCPAKKVDAIGYRVNPAVETAGYNACLNFFIGNVRYLLNLRTYARFENLPGFFKKIKNIFQHKSLKTNNLKN